MERKEAAFKGSWYPADGRECERQILRFLKERNGPSKGRFVGGIVPHAGWFFSGSIACRVIGSLVGNGSDDAHDPKSHERVGNERVDRDLVDRDLVDHDPVDLVLIFGHHMHPEDSPLIMGGGVWETPFGDLEIHRGVADALAKSVGGLIFGPDTFPVENTIELQLPFVRYFFPDAAIVPVGVPPSSLAEKIGTMAVEAAIKLGLTIRVIGTTDMTHYGPNYGFSPAGDGMTGLDWVTTTNDPKAVRAMVEMDVDAILDQGLKNHNLCCSGAVAAAVAACRAMGALRGVVLDYATSYERSPGQSFVGYSGVLFER
jgi:AmmeMemoRadiSam system protein B